MLRDLLSNLYDEDAWFAGDGPSPGRSSRSR